MPRCPNVADPTSVKLNFERLAAQSYVGQQQAWNYVSAVLEAYVGLAPRATCAVMLGHARAIVLLCLPCWRECAPRPRSTPPGDECILR